MQKSARKPKQPYSHGWGSWEAWLLDASSLRHPRESRKGQRSPSHLLCQSHQLCVMCERQHLPLIGRHAGLGGLTACFYFGWLLPLMEPWTGSHLPIMTHACSLPSLKGWGQLFAPCPALHKCLTVRLPGPLRKRSTLIRAVYGILGGPAMQEGGGMTLRPSVHCL